MPTRFLQFHTLTSYPAALLNRDDAGFAKRIPFGGATRTRVSSQCLKRHWRTFDGPGALSEVGVDLSVRSRQSFERFVYDPLVADGLETAAAEAVTGALMAVVLGESPKARKKRDEAEGPALRTGQITVLGRTELEYLKTVAAAVAGDLDGSLAPDKLRKVAEAALKQHLGKEGKKNLEAMRAAAGLDAAMFGRMTTGDLLARTDAAIHVAHAFTVHAEMAESDYFSAVDDLLGTGDDEDEARGSGHIGSNELNSGLFYGYTVVDIGLLIENLGPGTAASASDADRALAAEVVARLVRLIATVSPGAKLGSTAPYAYSSLVLVEAGDAQPRSLANAFLRPISPRPSPLENSFDALGGHLRDLDRVYEGGERRQVVGVGDLSGLVSRSAAADAGSLSGLAKWAAAQILEA